MAQLRSRAALGALIVSLCRLTGAGGSDAAAQECNRGQLDSIYCDENHDLVADAPTDPKRLRDCLQALSDACGHDVFRFEVKTTDEGHRFIITAPRDVQEVTIAKLIASELSKLYAEIKLDASGLDGPEDTRG